MAGWWHVLFLFIGPKLCWAHGKLTAPTPRDGISLGRPGLDENNPVSFEPGCNGPMNRCDAFVCREAEPNSQAVTSVTAGRTLQLQWSFAAFHVGDCSVYISYDVDLPRSQQKYVKIANLPDCKSYSGKLITIPASLPAGKAILRWDWAALHIWPDVEFYAQCADIQISSTSSATPADLDSYSINNPPIYPDNGNDGVGYRNAFNQGMAQDMTGPSCVDNSINDCSFTAPGKLRNTDSRRGDGGTSTTSQSTTSPAPTTSQSTTSTIFTISPSTTIETTRPGAADCLPIGDCSAFGWCNQAAFVEYCAGQGAASCPSPWCQATTSSTTATATSTTTADTSISTTTAVPTSGSCVASLTSIYTDASVWEPWCAAAWTAGSCPPPMCRETTSLLMAKSRKQSFLGTALLQSSVDIERAMAHTEL
eukprot:CAMPEP_0197624494 /NCGR_PEP_ID=MMETSP1338-20131121/4103_1 /TAXON_ID=43686 ORGANISM="Pelagodinium beii, Strain RCC1491" /NCGR_SAMPLE_ID=MMETSP1338 /ASSEMBLY_ACC=CAM_ASM_000754 /LENGTH=421 /DNA_ID=CAMNT_0043194633 /DNA_START=59 /DNA_END=1324 /DNA_ORIENTATION=+